MVLSRKKIFYELAKSGLTIKELSEKSGVSRSVIDKAKSERSVRPKSAGMIAKAFGVDVSEIVKEGGGETCSGRE